MKQIRLKIFEKDQKKIFPAFCATRWTAKVITLSTLLTNYATVLKTLEKIIDESVGESRSDSALYIQLMEDSQFIVALVVVQFVLSFFRCVTLALQSTECNLVDAYADVALVSK